MKFLRISMLTVLVFAAVVFIVVHSSCERNVCDNVTCFNGGSCASGTGKCTCPTGYTGDQCQTQATSLFIGVYAGYTQMNHNGANLADVIDSVTITQDPGNIDYVYVAYKSLLPYVLHGYVSITPSTYSIIIPSDSSTNYYTSFNVTLQGQILTVNSYLDSVYPGDTVNDNGYFKGSLQ